MTAEQLAEIIHDATPPATDGGVPDVCNRWDEHLVVARVILNRLENANLQIAPVPA